MTLLGYQIIGQMQLIITTSSILEGAWVYFFVRAHILPYANGQGGYRLAQKIYRFLLLSFAVASLLYLSYQSQKDEGTWSSWAVPLSGRVIVLDPGHGGKDGGAISQSGLVEKDLTLPIANYLRDYLQEAGALVLMTREGDYDLADSRSTMRKRQDLERRAALVNLSETDLLISIHLNSIPSARWRGAQTFYNPSRSENKHVATLIQEELITNLRNTDRQAKVDHDIYLLKSIHATGALVEVGFLSNPEEAYLLSNTNYQIEVAHAIYRGILRYFSEPMEP